MKLTEKEKFFLELALISYKQECYTRCHESENDNSEWQDQALVIEGIRRKMYKSKTKNNFDLIK